MRGVCMDEFSFSSLSARVVKCSPIRAQNSCRNALSWWEMQVSDNQWSLLITEVDYTTILQFSCHDNDTTHIHGHYAQTHTQVVLHIRYQVWVHSVCLRTMLIHFFLAGIEKLWSAWDFNWEIGSCHSNSLSPVWLTSGLSLVAAMTAWGLDWNWESTCASRGSWKAWERRGCSPILVRRSSVTQSTEKRKTMEWWSLLEFTWVYWRLLEFTGNYLSLQEITTDYWLK